MSRSHHTLPAGGTQTAGEWVEPDSFGTSISDAGDPYPPVATRLEPGGRVYLRGRIAWTSATISGGSTLLTVAEDHRPATPKSWSIRTGPNSNVSTILHLSTAGALTNEATFGSGGGSGTTAYLPLDGISWDLD
jgi:hypothetical protein